MRVSLRIQPFCPLWEGPWIGGLPVKATSRYACGRSVGLTVLLWACRDFSITSVRCGLKKAAKLLRIAGWPIARMSTKASSLG